MVDRTCKMLRNGCALDDFEDALSKLVKLTSTHFIEEEKLMRRYRYENLESHISTHKDFLDKLAMLQEQLLSTSEQGNEENKRDLLAFLEMDIRGHIEEDTKAWEGGHITKQYVNQRVNKHAVRESERRNIPSEKSTYSDAVMAFRGISKL